MMTPFETVALVSEEAGMPAAVATAATTCWVVAVLDPVVRME